MSPKTTITDSINTNNTVTESGPQVQKDAAPDVRAECIPRACARDPASLRPDDDVTLQEVLDRVATMSNSKSRTCAVSEPAQRQASYYQCCHEIGAAINSARGLAQWCSPRHIGCCY